MPRPQRRRRYRLPVWYAPFTGNLTKARRLFRQTYGFAHDDERHVDEVIFSLFDDYGPNHFDPNNKSSLLRHETVPVPVVLLLALMLRQGFRRGELWKDLGVRSRLTYARLETSKEEQRLLIPTHRRRYTRAEAREKAAETIAQQFGDVTAEQILAKDNWQGRRRRSRAKNKRPPPA
jgi:hypothetical protein